MDHPPPPAELWSLREDVHVETAEGGAVVVHSRWGSTGLPEATPAEREALHRMSLGPVMLENVVADPVGRRALLAGLLARLAHLMVRSLRLGAGQPLLSVVPLTPASGHRPAALDRDLPVRLSRFAVLRGDGREYVLESPLALHRVVLHRPEAVWAMAALARPVTLAEAGRALPAAALADVLPDVLGALVATGIAVQARAVGPPVFDEDDDPVLALWSPVDLMFHTRSTLGRHDHDFGETRPRGAAASDGTVVRPPASLPAVLLFRPRWDALVAGDPPLTVAVEGGRRRRDDGPPTVDEIGELLYRTVRVRSIAGPAGVPAATGDRPYPSLGGCYELEVYVTAADCPGLACGCYRYDPAGHLLQPLDAAEADVEALLDQGRTAAGLQDAPPVLLTITARFDRVHRRYEGPGYALVQKNAGALLHLIGLVVAAMGLRGRAHHDTDIETAARVFGTDWRVESSVGAFVVGRRPPASTHSLTPVNDSAWPELANSYFSQ
ncbi:SagB family peptide dehydrogenase [Actinocorallia aurantiaca]|uniref:SagB/ThcOx family dehydrogenase n=1 Tax=Actinocorallia aurantiaca TaxID=46204 RepID=A0ABP6H5D9_9ACTN